MNREKALITIQEILIDILDTEDVFIEENSSAEDFDGWDSLAHINIVTQVEEEFEVKFTLDEIGEFSSVKKIIDAIAAKK